MSSNSTLAPISYASSIVGFTSFAFTFFTFVRVFWDTIQTLWSAPKEMKTQLDQLRSELEGERDYSKSMLRRSKSRSRSRRDSMNDDLAVIRLLNDSVKILFRDLKTIEKPFLNESPEEKEKDVERSEESIRGDYAPMTLPRRWHWMNSKATVIAMADEVNRIQTRRIAHETSCSLSRMAAVERVLEDFEDRLGVIEEELVSAIGLDRRQ